MTAKPLQGKSAIVTGGSGTLGAAMAMALAEAGATVGILGRTTRTIQHVVDEAVTKGYRAISLLADVLDLHALEDARNEMIEECGTIDILVNCAGGNMSGATVMPEQSFFDLSLGDFDQVVDLNLKGTLLPTYVFAREMAQQKEGSIINISSMAAERPLSRVVGYSAGKAAAENFTRWLAVEMARKYGEGIRVNAIAPGFFVGNQNRALLLNDDDTPTQRGQQIINMTPMSRFGKPEELAGAVVWLAGDQSTFVTGAVIPIDGGFSAHAGV